MKISFDLNVNDWVAFQEYHRKKIAPFSGWMEPVIFITAAFVLLLGIWQIVVMGYTKYTIFALICLAVLLFLLYMRKKSRSNILKAGLELEKKHPEAFGPMNMELKPGEIDFQSQHTSKSLPSSELDKCEENKNYFFLYSKKGVIYILPKRSIEDELKVKEILDNYFSEE